MDPILILDDDAQALSSLSITLRAGGYQNLVFWTGDQDALPLPRQRSYRLVIVDLNTPLALSGRLLSIFTALDPQPPFLVLAGTPWRSACRKDGRPIDCLAKPVDRDQLLGAVRRILQAHEGAGRPIRKARPDGASAR